MMSWSVLLGVMLGGATGATLRYRADVKWGTLWGIFVVNVTGAALLGVVVAVGGPTSPTPLPPFWFALLGTGLAGALTTYSTFTVLFGQLWAIDRQAAAGYLSLTTGAAGLAALVPLLVWGQ